jgi:hypothetical protein
MLDPTIKIKRATPDGNFGGEGHSRLGLDTRGFGDEAMYRLRLQLWEQ